MKKKIPIIITLACLFTIAGYFVFLKNNLISEEKAEAIARPVFEKCFVANKYTGWNDEGYKIDIQSLPAVLIDKQLPSDSGAKKYWRIGVNFTLTDPNGVITQMTDSGYTEVRENGPEVFINAKTEEIADKNFDKLSIVDSECE